MRSARTGNSPDDHPLPLTQDALPHPRQGTDPLPPTSDGNHPSSRGERIFRSGREILGPEGLDGEESGKEILKEWASQEKKHGRLHQRAYRFTGSLYDAQDLVQELFLGLWGKRETLGEIDNPSGYLFRALTNRFIDSRRRAKVRPVEADLDLLLGFEPTSEDSNPKLDLLESGVIKALLGLTDKQRAMVVLVDIEGYLRAEAARELRVSYSSACRHYEIAHEKLREIVELPEGMVKEGQHELE